MNKIADLYRRCNEKNMITNTGFLTPTEQAEILKENYYNFVLFGGNQECDRKMGFFLPDYCSDSDIDFGDYITAYRVRFSFEKLSHRDFLGALMGLGIKRECIGDIYIFDNVAYFYSTKEITKFIMLNLDKVGRAGIKLEEISLEDVIIPEVELKRLRYTVQSVRLDSILAKAYNISRENMVKKIQAGLVFLNYLECQNVSNIVKEGDVISVKGLGKIKIISCNDKSSKGRFIVEIDKY